MQDPALILAFALVTLIFTFSVIRRRRRAQGRPFPPGPPGGPIVGNLFDIPKSQAWLGYKDLSETYGDIVHLRVLGQSIVVLGSAEVIVEYLDKRSANTSDRLQTPMIELSGASSNLSLFPYGPRWRRHRRIFWQHFYPRASLDYRLIQRDVAYVFLGKLLSTPAELVTHIRFTFAAAAFKVIYGINVLLDNDPYIAMIDAALEGPAQGLVPGKFLAEYLPFLQHIPTWLPGTSSQRLFKKWQAAGDRMKNEPYARAQADMMESGETRSIASQLIAKLETVPEEDRPIEEDMAKDVAVMALEAGTDTTFATLQALFLAMSLHPEVLRKAQAELDTVVGPDRLPDFYDEHALVYIQAIVLETLRWHNVVPLVPHCTTDDDELHGYFIPAGTLLVPNSWAFMHDPHVYTEPDAFQPERFIKDGQIDRSVRSPLDFVFGYGRRICPGRYFAQAGLFINIASVLHVFDIGPALDEDGNPDNITHVMTDGFLSYPEDCRCTIKPRSTRAQELILAHAGNRR